MTPINSCIVYQFLSRLMVPAVAAINFQRNNLTFLLLFSFGDNTNQVSASVSAATVCFWLLSFEDGSDSFDSPCISGLQGYGIFSVLKLLSLTKSPGHKRIRRIFSIKNVFLCKESSCCLGITRRILIFCTFKCSCGGLLPQKRSKGTKNFDMNFLQYFAVAKAPKIKYFFIFESLESTPKFDTLQMLSQPGRKIRNKMDIILTKAKHETIIFFSKVGPLITHSLSNAQD